MFKCRIIPIAQEPIPKETNARLIEWKTNCLTVCVSKLDTWFDSLQLLLWFVKMLCD